MKVFREMIKEEVKKEVKEKEVLGSTMEETMDEEVATSEGEKKTEEIPVAASKAELKEVQDKKKMKGSGNLAKVVENEETGGKVSLKLAQKCFVKNRSELERLMSFYGQ